MFRTAHPKIVIFDIWHLLKMGDHLCIMKEPKKTTVIRQVLNFSHYPYSTGKKTYPGITINLARQVYPRLLKKISK